MTKTSSELPRWPSDKEPTFQCRRCRFDPWVEKTPGKGNPVYLPWNSHGHRSLKGCSPWGHKRVRRDLATKTNNRKCNSKKHKRAYWENMKKLTESKIRT